MSADVILRPSADDVYDVTLWDNEVDGGGSLISLAIEGDGSSGTGLLVGKRTGVTIAVTGRGVAELLDGVRLATSVTALGTSTTVLDAGLGSGLALEGAGSSLAGVAVGLQAGLIAATSGVAVTSLAARLHIILPLTTVESRDAYAQGRSVAALSVGVRVPLTLESDGVASAVLTLSRPPPSQPLSIRTTAIVLVLRLSVHETVG